MIPPDIAQCQCQPNVLDWSFMSIGPMPRPVRCKNKPTVTVHENKPGRDGKCGAMSLCADCLALFKKHYSEDFATIIEIA